MGNGTLACGKMFYKLHFRRMVLLFCMDQGIDFQYKLYYQHNHYRVDIHLFWLNEKYMQGAYSYNY